MIDLRLGDSAEVLKTLKDNSIDSVVTDPPAGISFMGSGSTGIAAKVNSFSFIGIEKEEHYFQIAQTRINAYKQNLSSSKTTTASKTPKLVNPPLKGLFF